MNAIVGSPEDLSVETTEAMEVGLSSCVTTTLYDLIDALQTTVGPDDDGQVVETVTYWLRSGRIVPLGASHLQPAISSGQAGSTFELTMV